LDIAITLGDQPTNLANVFNIAEKTQILHKEIMSPFFGASQSPGDLVSTAQCLGTRCTVASPALVAAFVMSGGSMKRPAVEFVRGGAFAFFCPNSLFG